ncbi:hypothetical protein F383_37601 [Gossypium arboreum]|uniref:Uncharacterized protein n=1 Tax=Gossypium arboreum TaxID=29729 RepID=A0A0B0MGA7_GOSAR|nr:hypothetical protein F383_37601 [Gossypium arboreum]
MGNVKVKSNVNIYKASFELEDRQGTSSHSRPNLPCEKWLDHNVHACVYSVMS